MKYHSLKLVLAIFIITFCLNSNAKTNTTSAQLKLNIQPEIVGRKIISNVVKRRFGWRYQKVCTYYGALLFAKAINDKSISEQIKKGYQPFYEGNRKPKSGHVDYNVFGIWPFELYQQYGDNNYLNFAKKLADQEWEKPREDGLTNFTRFWIDDMYMIGALQLQAYKSTKNSIYLDRAALQIKVYCDKLQKTNGLFYHREDAPFYWGRGNGWACVAMTELLLVLPKNHLYYKDILTAYQKMMITLVSYQGKDGMWHQLLDDPKSYPETSCTGMFLYALASGINKGWLPVETYSTNVENAWNSLAANVNNNGKVQNVCIGTNAKNNKEHYLNRPKSTGNFHGQAAVLWAATAMVNLMNNKTVN